MSDEREWHFRDVWTEPPAGGLSVPKLWTNLGCSALTAALIIAVRNRDVSFDLLVGYAISVLILTVPTIGAKLVGLRWGRTDTNGAAKAPEGVRP